MPDFMILPRVPLSIKDFILAGHYYNIRLPRKFKKKYSMEVERLAMNVMSHDFIRQLGGI